MTHANVNEELILNQIRVHGMAVPYSPKIWSPCSSKALAHG